MRIAGAVLLLYYSCCCIIAAAVGRPAASEEFDSKTKEKPTAAEFR
jgi:hypothetical protein